ncbi:uncharacterized protein LOC131314930 isoform X5 [Rhododendron vialii]|uniref:uncharacterized protein LOC131314930 isoform X5 n=1 Tax=Rhododendron vialii TaxID=182163 RepID=UPI00265EF69C|nr:uncharacterized protein LOC131314930 isoform X5 [Rhododendron vialii]
MANDTRSTRRSKDDESTSSRKKAVVETAGTSGLRRSTRGTPSREQITTSPSTTRKSGRLESMTPRTPPVKRKSEIVDKHNISSPLRRSDRFKKHRRSDRFKKHQSASSSGTKEIEKGSRSSDVKSNKLKIEKSVKWLPLEGREANGIEKIDPNPVGVKRKKMDARTLRTFFKPQRRRDTVPADAVEELEKPDKLSPDDTSCCGSCVSKQLGDGEDGTECCGERMEEKQSGKCTEETSEQGRDSTLKNSEAEAVGNDGEVEVSCSSKLGSSWEEPCYSLAEESLNPSKSGQRLKRQRVENDSPEPELCLDVALNNGLHCSSVLKDSGELEANVQRSVKENDGTAQEESPSIVQIDGHQNMCVICKLGGKLMCCDGKGCKKSYHPSCLDLPLDDIPTIWHCLSCVQKKIESGVHSVSEGVESIWDAREVEVQDTEYGLQKQNQYFVKYKGLAHIHNSWVPERQLVLEAPLLVSKFNDNNKVVKWREEWKMPHRLLKKRLLSSPKQQEENQIEPNGDTSHCHCEWLVKWCGLDYEYATWELESAAFLQSPLAQSLMRKYENRHQRAKRATSSSLLDKNKKGPLVKVSKLPAGVLPGTDYNQLTFIVNKLREHWHKGQNAVLFDDQERVQKMILFIGSLASNISHPFLVISDSSALSQWEAEFSRLDSSIDVIVYSGKEDSRRIIRTCEFYEEGGCVMFQVLLSPIEALVQQDFEMLEYLRWEAIIVDECQCSAISKYFEHIKMLSTEVRFLLYNDQLKDCRAEHLNLLSLLESPSDLDTSDDLENDLDNNFGKLKERLSRFIVYDCKPDFSRFLEYWVPVQISNVQLEQYCATLHSNYASLRSLSKKDPFGTLHSILISTRKSCDHPYLVDPLLQGVLTKDLPVVELLGVGIKASGKLQLLDTILSNIRDRGLRVIILFQSIGGRDSIGDILEDFIGQRFGPDSYERLDGGFLSSKKKQAALNKFNDKGSGRFVFLLENRACNCSIKFSSVDGVVIFNGDWNPTNDIRALQKVSIGSSVRQIKVFRLYSPCTVEENVLVLATQDETLDIQSLSLSTIHMLLMWGGSYLFNKLDEFHGGNISTASASSKSEPSILKDVAKDFLNVLFQDRENNHPNSSLVIQVQHSGGTYRKNVSLLGELKIKLPNGEEPAFLWTKLLEGRNPQWRYSSGQLQRNRKRVQNFGDLLKQPELEADEVGKKRKKVVNSKADPASLRASLKEGGELSRDRGGGSELNMVDSEEAIGVRDVQGSLHAFLKREISTLCGILKLTEDVKDMVGKFLAYIIHNHHVNSEPASILQAFQISLCWIAASIGKSKSDRYKIDRKESILLAKKRLNFRCTEEEVNEVYLMMRPLKKTFLSRLENFEESERPQDALVAAEDTVKEPPDARMSPSIAFRLKNVKVEIEERSENQEFVENLVLSHPKETTLNKKCAMQLTKLIRKQQEEIQVVHRILEEERVQLENQHRVDSTLVRSIHGNNPVGLDKIRRLEDEFAKKKEEHNRKKDMHLKEVVKKQLAERNKMRQAGALSMGRPKSSEQAEPSCELPLDGSGFGGTKNIVSASSCLAEDQCSNGILASGMVPCVISSTAASEAVGGGVAVETPTVAVCPNHESSAVNSIAHENNASVDLPSAEEQIHDEAPSSIQDTPVSAPNQLVLQDERSQLLTSSGIPDIDELARENQNVLGAEVPPLHATDGSPEAVVIEHLNQLQLSSPSSSPVGPNQHFPHLASPVEQPPQSDGPVASLNAELAQHVENPSPSVPSDPVVLHCVANQLSGDGYTSFRNAEALSQLGVMEALPNQVVSSTQSGTRMPAKSVYADPLTTELERLRKQTEQTNTAHKDTILRLKSDLEKEIEEVIAAMRQKYVAKLNSEEAAFAQKKMELDTYHIKVLMNKRLADAFRAKCLERSSGALEMRRAVVPSASQQTTAPPLQIVHHSSALFSSMPNRPPLISPIGPSPGNLQTASERRAPAPHLQPFRPPPSTSARNLPIASPTVPHLVPSQPPPLPPSPMPPTYRSGLYNTAPHPEVAGGLPSLHNPSLSAMSLLFHMNNQPGANPPNILSPRPDLSSSFDALDISQFGSGGGDGMVNLASSGVATGVVCLSDDDE